MSAEFTIPGKIFYGSNALKNAGQCLAGMGRKALIVTGPHTVKSGELATLTGILDRLGIGHAVFSDIPGEPDDRMVNAALAEFIEKQCDFLIGFGGGSALDIMKAVAALSSRLELTAADLLGKNIDWKVPPMAAIPTTAGTGSEATPFTIVTDTETGVKMLLKGPSLMPDLAVCDPAFTLAAPPRVTAAAGLDALTHAIEAYTSRRAHPLTDAFALSAVRRIFACLPRAFRIGSDKEARSGMLLAALEAGIAFGNASVTLVHGMSRPVGALFHVPHGLSNAMLLPVCLSFALPGALPRFAELGRTIGRDGKDDKETAENFLSAVSDLCRECAVPSLSEYGVDRETFLAAVPKMTSDAIASGSPANTRRIPSEEDIAALYRKLF